MFRPLLFVLALAAPAALAAQQKADALFGTWEAKTKEGVRTVIIRPDSSASYGDETVRWRLQNNRQIILLALGGEWVDYRIKVSGKKMTLSGGDLQEPITLTRIGNPSPRPNGTPVPPDPDAEVAPVRKKGSGT